MKRLLFALPAVLMPVVAHAHPGAHDGFAGWQEAAGHLLGTPFHVALLLGGTAAAVVGWHLAKRTAIRMPLKKRD